MEQERMGAGRSGSSGASGGDQAAAHFSSRGFQAGGTPPGAGHAADGGFEAGREGDARPGLLGKEASRARPPVPESTLDASPTPHDKMATWTVGSSAGEAGGERGEGREAETKRRPPGTRRPAREPPVASGGAGGRRRPAEGSGLTFSCRSRPRRPPW